MSYIYLRESGGVSSAGCYSDIPAYALSRLSLSAEKFSCNASATESSQNSQSGTTCEHSMGDRGAGKSIVSAEASPAKTSRQQAKARASTEREAGCGQSSRVLLAKFDHNTRSWKTPQCSLFGDSDECLETFPRSGMMQNGLLWELMTLERPTDASASGYWRTPDTGAGGEISAEKAADFASGKTRASGSAIQIRLCDQVRYPQLWPTPTVCGNNNRKGLTKTSRDGLATAVLTYPTPKCQDAGAALFDRRKSNLGEVIHGKYLNGGSATPQTKSARLNPNWVEWLMGWPIGYTDSKPLATDKFRSWRQQLSTRLLQTETF